MSEENNAVARRVTDTGAMMQQRLVRWRYVVAVIQTARHGAPVIMGCAKIAHRGRMPLFASLTDSAVRRDVLV